MFGTITLQVDSILMWLMVIAMAGVMLFIIRKVEKRKAARYEAEHAARQAEYAERELKQKCDHQLNRGRQVFNWLERELKQYEPDGIKVRKIEDNGGKFAIYVVRIHEETLEGLTHIVQLDYDFVERQEPYLGHIHYGAYGEDFLFWVADHAPFHGLGRLVIKEVREYVEMRRESMRRHAEGQTPRHIDAIST